ncbi:hypothetical protein LAZ40_04350 [Cereibacter sphaeroides]|uniref:hypothetical protein n=1 Tax=Cereibacter sphaeroides TaxID=1063 RepID=UPI001F3C7647|nr:hypothetical protein [Cereibacter sphaeroides]MCE6958286.1 hypothetical protein [Cereibacter sphaeroides]MCE6971896.1 hypothetical protein [Cereibacter sphaeroides]
MTADLASLVLRAAVAEIAAAARVPLRTPGEVTEAQDAVCNLLQHLGLGQDLEAALNGQPPMAATRSLSIGEVLAALVSCFDAGGARRPAADASLRGIAVRLGVYGEFVAAIDPEPADNLSSRDGAL